LRGEEEADPPVCQTLETTQLVIDYRMNETMTDQKYVYSARVLHWLMAVGFLFMWGSGFIMTMETIEDTPLEENLFGLHISTGVMLVVLMIVRLAIRFANKPPALPDFMPAWEKLGSHLGHLGLYLLPIAVLTIGWAEVDFGGHGVKWFGIMMPKIFPTMEMYGGINLEETTEVLHRWLAYATFGLFVAHVLAVLKHRYLDGHDVLYRMSLKD
jgi:cytochrome b561